MSKKATLTIELTLTGDEFTALDTAIFAEMVRLSQAVKDKTADCNTLKLYKAFKSLCNKYTKTIIDFDGLTDGYLFDEETLEGKIYEKIYNNL